MKARARLSMWYPVVVVLTLLLLVTLAASSCAGSNVSTTSGQSTSTSVAGVATGPTGDLASPATQVARRDPLQPQILDEVVACSEGTLSDDTAAPAVQFRHK